MDISVFLTNSNFRDQLPEVLSPSQWINNVVFYSGDMDELDGKQIALIGVKEGRGGLANHGACNAPDEFRKFFYYR